MGEFTIWYQQIKKKTSKSSIEALNNWNKDVLSTIYRFLIMFAAFSGRSFSTPQRLKSYLKNTTGKNRLNSLTVINICRDILVLTEDVIRELRTKSRRKE